MKKISILFICLGNICRSPMAETIMRKYLAEAGLDGSVEVDSAGLESYHEGDRADPRMRAHAVRRGYDITHISRPMRGADWERFDMIIGMDNQNMRALEHRAPSTAHAGKLRRMTNYCDRFMLEEAVPDPYYGGEEGFEYVIDILEDACGGLLDELRRRLAV